MKFEWSGHWGTETWARRKGFGCDVCDAAIPTGEKRYPLDSGRICCVECWAEVKGTLADKGARAPEVKRSQESKHITLDLFGEGGKLSESSRTVSIGVFAGMVIGSVAGALFGLAWGIHEGDALAPREYGGRPDIGGAIIGGVLGFCLGALIGALAGYVRARPEK